MNEERIRQLAAHLRLPETAAKFNLDLFFSDQNAFLPEPVNLKPAAERMACGTTACIAGWAIFLFAPNDPIPVNAGLPDFIGFAGRLLDIEPDVAMELFIEGLMAFDDDDARYPRSPDNFESATVLDNLADTGEVDWTVA